MKEFFIVIITVVVIMGGIMLSVFGAVYWSGTEEASNDQYESINKLVKRQPELKGLLQDAMTDGILSINEYRHIQYVDRVRFEKVWDEDEKAERDKLRSELLETSYEKDKGE